MAEGRGLRGRFASKPFVFWVIGGGLLYLGIVLLALIVAFLSFLTLGFVLFIVALVVVFLLAAWGSLSGRRWGLIAGIVITLLTLILFSFALPTAYANPASPGAPFIVTFLPIAILVLAFSVQCLVRWKSGIASKKFLASHESTGGLITMVMVGFAIGSLITGVLAAPLIGNILAGAGQPADIRIVANAPGAADPYTPRNFTVAHDTTVTWYNADTNDHTVTSDTGLFASPNLHSGDRFSFRFTTPGTYPYHCEPHPNMTGKVIVT